MTLDLSKIKGVVKGRCLKVLTIFTTNLFNTYEIGERSW